MPELTDLELNDDVADLFGVEQQQIDEELVAVDGEVHLSADEREAWSELGEGVLEPLSQRCLDRPFPGPLGEVEEVEDVGVLDDLLGLVGVDRIQVVGEIARRGADPAVQAGGDVVLEHRPGPAVGGVASRVPVPRVNVVKLVEQGADVTPRQFPNGPLENCVPVGPGGGEGTHVLQVGRRQPGHSGKLSA